MKIDMHTHSFASYDGNAKPIQILQTAKQKGLDGIAITEHNNIKSWNDYRIAGQKLGMHIIFGEEIKTKQGDILAYFITSPIEKGLDAKDTLDLIHKQGGIAVLAHPFHLFEKFKDNPKDYINLIDGVEVFNARCPFRFSNKKARDFANDNNLAHIGGSDAHFCQPIGDGFTEVVGAKTLDEFKNGIIKKESIGVGKTSNYLYLLGPMFGKIKHLFR
jgi:predicted metal-dependent phosphoesterase TrpH